MKVTVLRGISGSGKSTWAKAQEGAVIVSTDDYFVIDGKRVFDKDKLQENHQKCFRAFMDAVMAKVPWIIVDNTNISAWEFAPYVLAGRTYGYDVEIVTMTCAFATCRARKDWLETPHLKASIERLDRETKSMPPGFKAIHRMIDTNDKTAP
jgi:predicted kinase